MPPRGGAPVSADDTAAVTNGAPTAGVPAKPRPAARSTADHTTAKPPTPEQAATKSPTPRRATSKRRLRSDNPDAYIAGDRRRALGQGTEMPDRVRGAALFADISGFTPLTEALANEFGPQRGAEELTAALDVVFDAVLGQLHRYGGSVIYFSGDAVTCWIDGDDGLLGVSCAFDMQDAIARVGTITTPGGTTVELGMKVAVAAGPARRFVVGDPDIQLIDVLAGSLMDRIADAEHYAERGDVVVDGPTMDALEGRVAVAEWRGGETGASTANTSDGALGDGRVAVASSALVPAGPLPAPLPYPKLPRAVVRQWLLPPVYERMRTGRGEFLSELRSAFPMFVRFGGIDYDTDEAAPELLDDFVKRAQRVVDAYGGNVLQLTIGDKGAYLYAVFGSPLAHEDDAARACAAALDLLALESATAATDLQIGIGAGRLRSGTYGHRQRRTFCCLGDGVNLAARLMSAAPPGAAYVSSGVVRGAGAAIAFDDIGELKVKGKAKPVPVRRVVGRVDRAHLTARSAHPLLGRAPELAQLLQLAEQAAAGKGCVVALSAEAGMGKTRLTEELATSLRDRDFPVFVGAAASVGGATSYLAWQPVVAGLLGLSAASETSGDRVGVLEEALEAIDPALVPRLPLLGSLFGVNIPDNELTAGFDPKLRKTSLESLVVRCLSVRAARGPFSVVLEDCHWLDPLSTDLFELVARAVAMLPVLVLVNHRPGSFAVPALAHASVIELDRLDDESCRALLTTRLAELYGEAAPASETLLERLVSRAEGNPFYLQELANFLHDRGADLHDAGAAVIELPASLSALVQSRIDTLAEPPRRTLKVASVVGREFASATLTGAYHELGTPRQVTGHLRLLCAEDLVVRDQDLVELFAFKHAVIRDVAYQSLPYALRAVVHGRIGLFLEAAEPDALDLLAHHFWNSAEEAKKREYLRRAGDAAKARYANDAAVDYYRKLATLVDDDERQSLYFELGMVLQLRADYAAATELYLEAIELAQRRADAYSLGRAHVARADPLQKRGRFDDAAAEVDVAERIFEEIDNRDGLGRVHMLRGLLANRRGDSQDAWAHLERSLAIRRDLGDREREAVTLMEMGVAAAQGADYDRACRLLEEALALHVALDKRLNIARTKNNLGFIAYLRQDYAAAVPLLEEAVRIDVEIGDPYEAALAQQNLGSCARAVGDPARACELYADALRAFVTAGDDGQLAVVFEDVAMTAANRSPEPALRLVGAAAALREVVGMARLAFEQEGLDEHMAGARGAMGSRAALFEEEGRSLDARAAAQFALELCRLDG